MKKQRGAKRLALQVERIRELVLENRQPVVGGKVNEASGYSYCKCGNEGGGGST